MPPEDFLVEADLQLRHVPFDLAELRVFVADVWPVARHEPDPQRWAEAFLVALAGACGGGRRNDGLRLGVGGLALLALLVWGAARLRRVRQGSEDRRYFGGSTATALPAGPAGTVLGLASSGQFRNPFQAVPGQHFDKDYTAESRGPCHCRVSARQPVWKSP